MQLKNVNRYLCKCAMQAVEQHEKGEAFERRPLRTNRSARIETTARAEEAARNGGTVRIDPLP